MSAVAAPAAVVLPSPRPSVDDDGVSVLPSLFVPEASQWLSTSTGRIAPDGYSWLQAVHWVAGSKLYEPRRYRSHGPRSFGPTTVRVAQELAQLFPCRPGIEYLMRRTGLAERAVEYHLGMLREAGLLAWIVKGTRVSGGPALASEFARMIPVMFDAALGIRTVRRDEAAPAYTRSVTGIAEAGRELMAKLGKKAARKLRRPRPKTSSKTSSKSAPAGARKGADGVVETPVSAGSRCTPMGGGADGSSTAGTTSWPPESKLASGQRDPSTPKKSKATGGRRRKLNQVGRRYQLAAELIQQVPWLARASTPRIAWVVREVADAGWSATEVRAWLDCLPEPRDGTRRPSGLLASRLKGMTAMPGWTTPEHRALAVQEWRDSRRAEHARHQERAGWGPAEDRLPASRAAQRQLATACAQVRAAAHDSGPYDQPAQVLYTLTGNETPAPKLTDNERIDMQAAAQKDPAMIDNIVAAHGETYARDVFGHDLVDQVQRMRHTDHLVINHPWQEYA